MNTLIGEEISAYLSHLEREIQKKQAQAESRGMQAIMHSTLREIVIGEKGFLEYVGSSGVNPMLSISPNGLPSVASLVPDLEKMCELASENPEFDKLAKMVKKGKKESNIETIFVPVAQADWETELHERNDKLRSEFGISIRETPDGKFRLTVDEEIYVEGYDKMSSEVPLLIRRGKTNYHVLWNRLMDETDESFYIHRDAPAVKNNILARPRDKVFDNISVTYNFLKKDFEGFNFPFFGWKKKPLDYAKLLACGTSARIKLTNTILYNLSWAMGREIFMGGVGKSYLEETLAFAHVPFANSPSTIPSCRDFYVFEGESIYSRTDKTKLNTKFELVSSFGPDKIGAIEYILPQKDVYSGSYGGTTIEFKLGGIKVDVLGSSIKDGSQFANILRALKEKHWRR